jgi:uncharacterized protein (TIGR02646 family)
VSDFYKHQEVKKALEKLFYDKCAYCESKITVAGSWDVEHYRPKGRVAERDDHPGYYWLAYMWENLYPSCKLCNQRRKDQPRFDDPTMGDTQGKLDQFPIENEDNRAMTPAHDISLENPLLLDPNNKEDDPEKHFTYDIKGNILPVDTNDRFATETIRICHLDRRRLNDARSTIIIRARELMKRIKLAESSDNNLAVTLLRETFEDMKAPKEVYIGAIRAVERDPDAFSTSP